MNVTTLNDPKVDDVTLINRLALKQGDAISDLYDRYGRLVYSIAINAVEDQAVAEEIVQDVFISVWEKAKTYDASIARVSTWLATITRNRAIDEIRRRNVRPEKNSISWADVIDSEDPVPDQLPGPEKQAELLWLQRSVREAMEDLTSGQKQVLGLAYFRGYTQSRIAEMLDLPLGTVKTRIRMGMQKLRLVLDQTMLDESK